MNNDNYLNNCFNKNFDNDYERVFELSEKNFSHEELLNMLNSGNVAQKQIAALKFDYVKTECDAKALLSNLTGCDGKIRESVALAINRILSEDDDAKTLFAPISAEIFANATIDINANICRLVVEGAIKLKQNEIFNKTYTERIIQIVNETFLEIDKFVFRDKKYVINKQIFKLYWCLEALNYFWENIETKELENILVKSSELKEYTIREKAAQMLVTSNKFPYLANKLKNDENYYVRNMFV